MKKTICFFFICWLVFASSQLQAQAYNGFFPRTNLENPLVIEGTEKNDRLFIREIGEELIVVLNGQKKIYAKAAFDGVRFSGNAGNDRMVYTASLPVVAYGEEGNDRLTSTNGPAEFYGGAGADTLVGSPLDDVLYGGAGDDRIYGNDGDDFVSGGYPNLIVLFVIGYCPPDDGDDWLDGGNGDDELDGGNGDNILFGGLGNDGITVERYYGCQRTPGNNLIYGEQGDDLIRAGDGDDMIQGGPGDDEIYCHGGDDYANGGSGNDDIDGGTGKDQIVGGSGDDRLFGGADFDRIFGNAGRDIMHGGEGSARIRRDRRDAEVARLGMNTLREYLRSLVN